MSKRNRAARSLAERERQELMGWIAENRYRLSWVTHLSWHVDLWIFDKLFNEPIR